ncbi:hypothetical protein RRG08_016217 [Elysia crispata]|uniref:Uncharacterized protein n=1 Tax=Elysia crispata TaxID=231223 RepID=A0AAE1DJK5_9GAST|nr:hypothetical protein RRG08_016217 [Elysia crispata]
MQSLTAIAVMKVKVEVTYVEEHVQRTGVAIETQGFTVVTSGRKRESLTGNATMHLYPYLEPLRQIDDRQSRRAPIDSGLCGPATSAQSENQ